MKKLAFLTITILISFICVATAFFCFSSLLYAAVNQKPLTGAEIEKFLKIFPDYIKWASSKGSEIDAMAKSGTSATTLMAMAAHYAGAEEFFTSKGTTLEEFSTLTGRIMSAWGIIIWQDTMAVMQKSYQDTSSSEAVENNPYLTPEQKAEYQKGIKESQEEFKKSKKEMESQASSEDVKLVKQYQTQINTMMESLKK